MAEQEITEINAKPFRAVLGSVMVGTGAIVSYSVWASHNGAVHVRYAFSSACFSWASGRSRQWECSFPGI